MSYDTVPDLAALIDGLHDLAALGGHEQGTRWWNQLGDLYVGPYARLRGGLLLDEPGREHVSTEQAIREALTACGWVKYFPARPPEPPS